jgi:hypothetical protein
MLVDFGSGRIHTRNTDSWDTFRRVPTVLYKLSLIDEKEYGTYSVPERVCSGEYPMPDRQS